MASITPRNVGRIANLWLLTEPRLDLNIEKIIHYETHFGSRGVSRKTEWGKITKWHVM
jgi:hypothetical protein